MEDTMKIHLGNDVYVKTTNWGGQPRTHIRLYKSGFDEFNNVKHFPTKTGVCLSMEQLKVLNDNLSLVFSEMERLIANKENSIGTSNPQLQMDGLPSGCEAAYTQCGFNYIPTYTPSPLPTTMNNPDMLSMPLLDYMDNSEPMTLPNQPVTPLSIPTVTPHVTRPKKDTKRAKLTQINKNVS